MMKTRLFLCALCAALYSGLCAQTLTVTVKNPADYARSNYPVTLSLADYPQTRSAVVCEHVLVGNRPELIQEIPSQVSSGEVIFVADVPAGGERTYTVELNTKEAQQQYPERVHAHLKLWDNKHRYPRINEIEFKGDVPSLAMYDAIYGHGAMWESEYVGFRVYMDHRQSIDLYGKQYPQMELDSINFYATRQDLGNGFGEDILWAGQSVGAGSFRGWRDEAPVYVDSVLSRKQRVVEEGPVRTIVEVVDRDWQINGRTLQMVQRYTMYAGHRDVQVDVWLEGAAERQTFCTGAQKLEYQNVGFLEKDGLVGSWGLNIPDKNNSDLVEGVGIGVCVDKANLRKVQEDDLNYLCLLRQREGHIRYHLAVAALMQKEGGFHSGREWFQWLHQWQRELQTPCIVSVTK